ncbi:hypothetical protein F5878DRAFT_352995 [Lentinula raphanica]|uniref:Uncharacterized protein n=1 Tax=Lentinula raphanica TaxID=153919 RepID=A0AA38P1F6_9AGAR|nr:hypothetical protein F5878DRAFT_352995 [Lentinula raphanica]
MASCTSRRRHYDEARLRAAFGCLPNASSFSCLLLCHIIHLLTPSIERTRNANARSCLSQYCNMKSLIQLPARQLLEIGFLGTMIHVEIPHTGNDVQQISNTMLRENHSRSALHILASAPPFHPPPLLLFEASPSHLWSIWECLVLCEPILLFGSSPAQTSQAAWWFRDLLRPGCPDFFSDWIIRLPIH